MKAPPGEATVHLAGCPSRGGRARRRRWHPLLRRWERFGTLTVDRERFLKEIERTHRSEQTRRGERKNR